MVTRRSFLCLLAMLAAVPVAGARADAAPWAGEPSMIAGTARYDAGEWIYTDFVYDDYGADTVPAGQPNVVSLASTSGDFRYPSGPSFLANAADIAEVRARIAGDDLEIRARLQTITDPSVVALWADVDGDETVLSTGNASVDADANTVTFTLPGVASQDQVRLALGAGLHDGQGGLRAGMAGYAQLFSDEFTTGGPTDARLFDLAFNSREVEGRGGAWNEDVQSDALAAGDLSAFAQTIDLEALRTGTVTEPPVPSGYSVRLFESRQDLGEGMGGSFPQYRGRRQPYAIWIPQDYDGVTPVPLLLNLHSLSVHHNQYRGGSSPSASYPTMYEQLEAGLGAIVVTPLGRGPDGWYEDEALVDTLEVWADVLDAYVIDAERVYVGGYSMGGYGTYRLTTLMPDAFASAFSIVGPPANGIWAYPLPPTGGEDNPDNTRPQLESTRHIPFWITQGVMDELVPFAGIINHAQRFAELGHEYRFALHPVADHFAFVFQDDWSREIGWLAAHEQRTTDPHRVTFDVRPASWATGGDPVIVAHLEALIAEVGARLDGAYWVDDIVLAAGDDVTGVVDLSSGGIERRHGGVSSIATAGVDGPSPHLLTGQDIVWETGTLDDTLSGSLTGVTALTVDVGRAALSDSPTLDIASDVPATITFVRDGVTVGAAQIG